MVCIFSINIFMSYGLVGLGFSLCYVMIHMGRYLGQGLPGALNIWKWHEDWHPEGYQSIYREGEGFKPYFFDYLHE